MSFLGLLFVTIALQFLPACILQEPLSVLDISEPPIDGKEEIQESPDKLSDLISLAEKSKKSWEATKAKISDSYSYTIFFSSGLAPSARTDFIVASGKVVSRKYHRNSSPIEEWTEGADAIGTHRMGAQPATIDALYDECLNIVLKRRPECSSFTVTTFPDGTLKDCYNWPCGLVDDAAHGVQIGEISYPGFSNNLNHSEKKSYDGCAKDGSVPDTCREEK